MSQSKKILGTSNSLCRVVKALTFGIIVSVFSATVLPAMAQSSRILRYSDHEPLGGMRTRFLKDVVFPAIEKESNGRIRIDDHWDGEIAAAYDALSAVSKGSVDMGTVVPEYSPKELPLQQIFKSFPVGPSSNAQVNFFRQVYSQVPAFTQELGKNNVVPLFFGTGYPVAFFSTNPMANLEGLKGGKWRSASFWHSDFLRNAGATPVTMPWGPEVVRSLKAKTLDGLMVNVDSGYMLKVQESALNVLVSKDLWLGHLYLLTINKEVWATLAQRDKDAITRATDQSYRVLGAVMEKSFETQLDDLRKAGAIVRILTADEVQRWASVSRYGDVQSAWAQDQKSHGVEGIDALVMKVRSVMDEFVH